MKHKNVPIFVPHAGCPHTCSFCNQNNISDINSIPTAKDVTEICKKAWDTIQDRHNTEIAFFGGSFTALDRSYMESLLKAANAFIGEGKFYGIRLSTRPDAIDEEVLEIIKRYGVTSIELGVQSLHLKVLDYNNRGHTVEDVDVAVSLIHAYGFSLGLQMMIGLYGDTEETLFETARKIIGYQPETVRIYPTVILKGTYLEQLYKQGVYHPISLEKAVAVGAELLLLFHQHHIKVIRMGLHDSEGIQKNMVGGIYHPAFRELCESKIYFDRAYRLLQDTGWHKAVLLVNKRSVSKMTGQNRKNIEKLHRLGFAVKVQAAEQLGDYEVKAIEDV